MLECYKQGLANVNYHRKKTELSALEEPYHNTYMEFEKTVDYLSKDYEILETIDFSTYYYLTRCLAPFVIGDDSYDLDEKMRLATESDDILQGSKIGAQTLLVLRKNGASLP